MGNYRPEEEEKALQCNCNIDFHHHQHELHGRRRRRWWLAGWPIKTIATRIILLYLFMQTFIIINYFLQQSLKTGLPLLLSRADSCCYIKVSARLGYWPHWLVPTLIPIRVSKTPIKSSNAYIPVDLLENGDRHRFSLHGSV